MKYVLLFAGMCLLLILASSQVNAPKQKVRMMTVTLTFETWSRVMYSIDKSRAEHDVVKMAQDSLLKQLNDTIKNPLK